MAAVLRRSGARCRRLANRCLARRKSGRPGGSHDPHTCSRPNWPWPGGPEIGACEQRDRVETALLATSPQTVRNHLKSIYRKVGVTSQVSLVRKLLT